MMDRKVRAAKRSRAARSLHSTKTPSKRGAKVSLLRIVGPSRVEHREHHLEHAGLDEAREALIELFDLLEEYAPVWYTEAHRERALAAMTATEES